MSGGGKHNTLRESFANASRGLFGTLWAERNMRIHAVAAVYVLFFAPFLGVSRAEYGVLILCCGAVMAAECVNTALEQLADAAHPEWDKRVGRAKDAAAGAVLLLAAAAVGVGIAILWRPAELLGLLAALWENKLLLLALVLSLAASVGFICTAPKKGQAPPPETPPESEEK